MEESNVMSTPFLLTVESGPHAGQQLPVTSPITVGRQADNTLAIEDAILSRHHARFEMRDAALLLTDLGSANGTSVNGQRITSPRELYPGDLVEFGETTLRVGPASAISTTLAASSAAPPPSPASPVNVLPPSVPPAPVLPVPNGAAGRRLGGRTPLLIGGIVGVFLLCCLCGALALVLASRGGRRDDTPAGGTAGGTAVGVGGSGGLLQPTSQPVLPVGGGAAGVARGDYLCQSFTTVGLATVGGLHILSDTAVTYSTNADPVSGATQYHYTYQPATNAISFTGGPYDGREGTYDSARRVIQVSPSVGCTWQR
jgi:pSer/pThr/pTyr-binding forkhead associated (FHA) protein